MIAESMNKLIKGPMIKTEDLHGVVAETVIAEDGDKVLTILSYLKEDLKTDTKYVVYNKGGALKSTPFISEAIVRYNSL